MGMTVDRGLSGNVIQADPDAGQAGVEGKADSKSADRKDDSKLGDRSRTAAPTHKAVAKGGKEATSEKPATGQPLKPGLKTQGIVGDDDPKAGPLPVDTPDAGPQDSTSGKSSKTVSLASTVDTTDRVDTKASVETLANVAAATQPNTSTPKSDSAAALAFLQDLEPLLGEPNGKPIGDAFAFDFVRVIAQLPAVSPELVQLRDQALAVIEEASPGGDKLVLQEKIDTSAEGQRLRNEMMRNEKLVDLVDKQFYTLLTTKPESLLANMPIMLVQVIQQQMPAIIKAMSKQPWVKGNIEEGVSLATAAEVKEENEQVANAFGPIAATKMALLQRISKVDPEVLKDAYQRIQNGENTDDLPPEVVQLANDIQAYASQVSAAGSDTPPPPPASFATVTSTLSSSSEDLLSLVELVMMECAKNNADILRDIMDELQKANLRKQAQREKVNAMETASAKIDAQMQEEYAMLKSTKQIDPSITFDQYASWRQVAWGDGMLTDDGHFKGPTAQLTPLPDIPEWMQPGKPVDTDGSKLSNVYGLDPAIYAQLQKMWDALPVANGKPVDVDTWLAGPPFKLKQIDKTGKDAVDEIISNMDVVAGVMQDPTKLNQLHTQPPVPVTPAGAPGAKPITLQEAEDRAKKIAFAKIMEGAGFSKKPPDDSGTMSDDLTRDLATLSSGDQKTYNTWVSKTLPAEVRSWGNDIRQPMDQVIKDAQDWNHDDFTNGGAGSFTYTLDPNSGQLVADVPRFEDGDVVSARPDQFFGDPNRRVDGRQPLRTGREGLDMLGNYMGGTPHQGVNESSDWGWTDPTVRTLNHDQTNQIIGACTNVNGIPTAPNPAPDVTTPAADPWAGFDQMAKSIADGMALKEAPYKAIQGMPQNANGEFYGDVPVGAGNQTAFDNMVRMGVIKKGISPEEQAKIEADKQAARAAYDAFVAGTGPGVVKDQAMALNHLGAISELKAAVDGAKRDLDTMGDVTQLMQMRLQKYMDAYTKAFEMLSNLVKKIATTMDDGAQNLK